MKPNKVITILVIVNSFNCFTIQTLPRPIISKLLFKPHTSNNTPPNFYRDKIDLLINKAFPWMAAGVIGFNAGAISTIMHLRKTGALPKF